jgi:hypothetical protein
MHIFLGIDAQKRCYRLAQLPSLKLVTSAHVTFKEDMFPCKDKNNPSTSEAYRLLDTPNTNDGDPMANPRPQRGWTP